MTVKPLLIKRIQYLRSVTASLQATSYSDFHIYKASGIERNEFYKKGKMPADPYGAGRTESMVICIFVFEFSVITRVYIVKRVVLRRRELRDKGENNG